MQDAAERWRSEKTAAYLSAAGHPWPTSIEDVAREHKNYGSGTLRAERHRLSLGICRKFVRSRARTLKPERRRHACLTAP